jgi:hypothetical protein
MARSAKHEDPVAPPTPPASASPPAFSSDQEKHANGDDVRGGGDAFLTTSSSGDYNKEAVHRRLKSRHIQLIGIGGTIGTLLFVRIGFPEMILFLFFFWRLKSNQLWNLLPPSFSLSPFSLGCIIAYCGIVCIGFG